MTIEHNILNLYDFEKFRGQLLDCFHDESLIDIKKEIFQNEYKILRKAALDFIDELNLKIHEVEVHPYYGTHIGAKNSIYYLKKAHSLQDTSQFKVYGIPNFVNIGSIRNLLFFLQAVETMKKDALIWIESFRLPLKFSKKREALVEIWNEHMEKCEEFDREEFQKALDDIDHDEEYSNLSGDTFKILKVTERTINEVAYAYAPFHKFASENVEAIFDSQTSQALINLGKMDEILNRINESIFNSRFKN